MEELTKTLKALEDKIGVDFADKNLLINAFVHRSYLNENRGFELPSNERLEYLGDACLELVVSEYLFKTYPKQPEGILTSYRGSLVNTDSLAESARIVDLGAYLLLSRGEEDGGGRDSNYLLANTFEAVIGALYLDQGYEEAKKFIHAYVTPKLVNIIENEQYKDPKSKLQELTQEVFSITPQYKVVNEEGPDHNKSFEVEVSLGSKTIGAGRGSSKQKAELDSAQNALDNWDDITDAN
ncbi:ribonuclease III [candidate division WWE3 bacterium]|uniref:Ribonuclease 3 n=1 Tax=candidate division WWE3 bacterium TaxID=2053526 RepID=A0A955LJY1_UNCKA|nr:ribonuclease III [candidate division WWE3 bacterium]